MSNERNFQPGDVEIVKIKLYSHDGSKQYNLNAQARAIDIYESVTSPIIFARLYIDDAIDLARQFPILGEEYVEFEFRLPESEQVTKYKLFVKSMSDMIIDPNQKIKSYTLDLVSEELFENASQLVSGRPAGYRENNVLKGDPTHKAIGKIIKENLHSNKKYYYEETKGIDEVLIALQPFPAIDWLRQRAVSIKNDSSSFCFFENQKGYVLSTLEKLFEDNRKNIGDKIFWTDTDTRHSATQNMFRNIIGYKQVQFVDTLESINQGGFRNQTLALDILTGEHEHTKYTDSQDNNFKTVDEKTLGQHTSGFTSKYSKSTSHYSFMIKDNSRDEMNFDKRKPKIQAYTQKIIQNLVHVHLWGDNTMTVGDVISCYMPEATGMSENKEEEDRLLTGNFLISKLVHKINLHGGRHQYTMACELIKGGILER